MHQIQCIVIIYTLYLIIYKILFSTLYMDFIYSIYNPYVQIIFIMHNI